MKQILLNLRCALISLPLAFYACGSSDAEEPFQGENEDIQEEVLPPVSDLKATPTQHANELRVSWQTPKHPSANRIELSYLLEGTTGQEPYTTHVKTESGNKGSHQFRVPQWGTYKVTATVLDNYGKRSKTVSTSGTPAEKDAETNWAGLADSCTHVLIEQFMDKNKGTFWSTPHDMAHSSQFIYWQQAHAIDVVVYSYERIKESNPTLARTYETYFDRWFDNKANNYHRDGNDPTGFLNPFTDDMCWISLSMLHLTEATGKEKFAEMARKIYDNYIITRAWSDEQGTGLPWKSDDRGRNACTNSPGCLVAAKLYAKYQVPKYLSDAQTLYKFVSKSLLKDDGRVEEPPLTYTQGTFGEACRQLYHLTGDESYMRMAEKVIRYTTTSDRCLHNGILRSEGNSMDQSIFKAVFVPYAVNLALDEKTTPSVRTHLQAFIEKNAETLNKNLLRDQYPAMYCDYYWGNRCFDTEASMGAQTSGASLMEGMARLKAGLSQ